MRMVELSRKGVTKNTLLKVAELGSMSLKELAQLLPVTERTIQRYGDDDRFPRDVSEHVLMLAEVFSKGLDVLGDRETLRDWLRTPIAGLGQPPLDLLDTSFGVELVKDELGRLEEGVFS